MSPTPDAYLSVNLTVTIDPPLTEESAMEIGDRAASRLAGQPAHASASWEVGDLVDRVTWSVPLPRPQGEPLGSVASRLEQAAREEAGGAYALTTIAVEALTLDELERRADDQQRIRGAVVGVDEFRELLGDEGYPISRTRLYELRKREDFPAPIARGVWARGAAEHYARTRRRAAGRPRKALDVQGNPCEDCGHLAWAHGEQTGDVALQGAPCRSWVPDADTCPCAGYVAPQPVEATS